FEQFVLAAMLAEEWFYGCHCCLDSCYVSFVSSSFVSTLATLMFLPTDSIGLPRGGCSTYSPNSSSWHTWKSTGFSLNTLWGAKLVIPLTAELVFRKLPPDLSPISFMQFEQFVLAAMLAEEWFYVCVTYVFANGQY
ncbi:putative SPbeta prophage-derived protein YotG, partial [Frankliniella fusca]